MTCTRLCICEDVIAVCIVLREHDVEAAGRLSKAEGEDIRRFALSHHRLTLERSEIETCKYVLVSIAGVYLFHVPISTELALEVVVVFVLTSIVLDATGDAYVVFARRVTGKEFATKDGFVRRVALNHVVAVCRLLESSFKSSETRVQVSKKSIDFSNRGRLHCYDLVEVGLHLVDNSFEGRLGAGSVVTHISAFFGSLHEFTSSREGRLHTRGIGIVLHELFVSGFELSDLFVGSCCILHLLLGSFQFSLEFIYNFLRNGSDERSSGIEAALVDAHFRTVEVFVSIRNIAITYTSNNFETNVLVGSSKLEVSATYAIGNLRFATRHSEFVRIGERGSRERIPVGLPSVEVRYGFTGSIGFVFFVDFEFRSIVRTPEDNLGRSTVVVHIVTDNAFRPFDEEFVFGLAQFHLEEVATCPSVGAIMPRRVEISVRLTVYEITGIFTFVNICHGAGKLTGFGHETINSRDVAGSRRSNLVVGFVITSVAVAISNCGFSLFYELAQVIVALGLSHCSTESINFSFSDGANVPRRGVGGPVPRHNVVDITGSVHATHFSTGALDERGRVETEEARLTRISLDGITYFGIGRHFDRLIETILRTDVVFRL